MIIECVNCPKKFNIDSNLIPTQGRTLRCGVCNHVWFYKKNLEIKVDSAHSKNDTSLEVFKRTENFKKQNLKSQKKQKNREFEVVEYKAKKKLNFTKILNYILVFIISFIAIIVVIDTFKSFFYNYFPKLELILFHLFETLKDINLFIKDLFKQ